MSIFPRKAVTGQSVTIHTSVKPLTESAKILNPLIRVNVVDPQGNISLIFEK